MPALLPSELPVRVSTRHHWITLLRPPNRWLILALVVMLLAAIFQPFPMALLFGAVAAALAFVRWQTWHAEQVILTGKRIIRVQGVPETTSSESSLRVDRISGARLVQSVPGKILGYGTIDLEAPGNHPDVRHLTKIAHPQVFYLALRQMVFGEPGQPDPDEDSGGSGGPPDYITEPLPPLPA